MNTTIACDSLRNFRSGGKSYRIVSAGFKEREPHAKIEPHDEAFHAVLLEHMRRNGAISSEDVGYPECFRCFAGEGEREKKLLLKQIGKE